MRRLISYSFKVLILTVVVFMIVRRRDLSFPLYWSIPFCFAPWIVFEIVLSKYLKSAILPGIILETVSIISALILLDTYLFSIFLIGVFVQIFRLYQLKRGLFISALILSVLVILHLLLKNEPDTLILFIPVVLLSVLLDQTVKKSEAEMRAEIDAQQKQIDGKNKLLSTLSHELRTPLAVIKTSTEILLEERPGKINATQKKFLDSTLDNTMRLVRFVDTILASIKVEYAWFRMKKKAMDLRPVIRKVCTDMLPFISSREQELKYTYPNLLSKTIADENWIQQVLINLIHNASKHIGKKGRIVISVTENEQCVVVSVSDDGSGILNQDKPRIFSEFYQGGVSEESNMDGVGLGLSIVKDVIEKHNGKVYVGSVAGLGTTLSFTLPKEDDA